ncbi:hypothetical protein VM98_05875 [Streptomyces rubellomurinus subsp. indigoferus]|nr:hypothetical protein VM98_05875 [Streptomyces rubellomurinus subsp. indigoferus]
MPTTATASTRFDARATVKKCTVLFGAISAIVLGTVAVLAALGHGTTPFMWIRAALFLAAAPYIHRLEGRSTDRLRAVATVLPIAIIGVDLVPGLCPAWYAVLQGLSALPLAAVAVIVRRR